MKPPLLASTALIGGLVLSRMMVMVSYGLGIGLAAAAMIARGVAGLLVGAVACGALA